MPRSEPVNQTLPTMVPVKPILMCFICKLSFADAKSFANHCGDNHSLVLSDDEQSVLDDKNASAIVQYVGKEQEVTLSFLEPVTGNQPGVSGALGVSGASPVLAPTTTMPNASSLNNLVSLMNDSATSQTAAIPTPASTGTFFWFFFDNQLFWLFFVDPQIC